MKRINGKKINVLGTIYTIYERTSDEDKILEDADGYCDKTVKQIIISKRGPYCNLQKPEEYTKKLLRHEIIHAFLYESGFDCNIYNYSINHNEIYVDWYAYQFSKILKVFNELEIL